MLAQVAPGELSAKLPASAPEQGEPFANVLRDLDELIVPAMTNWQHPRFFAYFAITASRAGHPRRAAGGDDEPGGDPLAGVARVDGARAARRRLGAPAARAAGRLARAHRGHRVDVDARRARSPRGTSTGRNVVVCSEHAHSAVGEGGADARDGAAEGQPVDDELRMRVDGLELDDVAAVVADRRDDVVRVGRSGARAGGARARGGRVAARRRCVRRLVVDLRGGAVVAGRRRARRLARRQPAQVAADADGLLVALDVAAGRVPRRRSRSCRSTCARPTMSTRSPSTGRRSGGASAR